MHQCLKCKKYFEDEEVPIIDGCSCGGHIFLFVKQPEDVDRAEKVYEQIESKIQELEQQEIEEEKAEGQQELTTPPEKYEKTDTPKESNRYASARKAALAEKRKFGVETIRVKDMGVFEINLDALMKGRPIIVLSKGGSYVISLPSIFGKESEVVLKKE